MAYLYYSAQIGEDRSLFLAPLSSRKLSACTDEITDVSGYFLYEEVQNGALYEINILAQVHSDDAAFKLSRMFNMT